MAEGCGPQCAKIMLILFNIIFWLSGAALLGVGIWVLVDNSLVKYIDFFAAVDESGALLKYAAYILIAVGCFVLVVGFCGCCGAIRESQCLLGLYIFFLVIVMAGEIALGVLAIIFKGKLENAATNKFQDTLREKYNKTTDAGMAFTDAVMFVEREGKCCGLNGFEDYRTAGVTSVPVSCCKLKDEAKEKNQLTPSDAVDYNNCVSGGDDSYIDNGCKDALETWVKNNSIIVIGVGIGIACLELFGFIFAICLCRNVGDSDK